MTETKPVLIYVGDPMCSWCYGVAEEMTQVKDHFSGEMDFEIVMGGLRPYNTQTMAELKDFLSHHWEEVHARSGLEFKYDILDDTSMTYDTEPPCRACVIVRLMKPEVAFSFFKETQRAFYLENKNMHLVESYTEALEKFDIDVNEFQVRFSSQEAWESVQKDFARSARLGVRGFPTLILKKGDEYYLVANGYMKAEVMIRRCANYLIV